MADIANTESDNSNRLDLVINDTPLTRALENADIQTAVRIIANNSTPGYLDEGPFDKCPLILVLSGDAGYRHLRLAEILVKGGADPNHRINHQNWRESSTSPLECLVTLYLDTCTLCNPSSKLQGSVARYERRLKTIGLHDENITCPMIMKEQLFELLDVFLMCGGNPNVNTSNNNSSIFHVALMEDDPDMDLVVKLFDAGGNFNQLNVHGTTPLMDLVSTSNLDSAMDILSITWCEVSEYPSINSSNCSKETALWRSMLAGSPRVAKELICRGADLSLRAIITQVTCLWLNSGIDKRGVSALFAPLLQNSSPYRYYNKVLSVEYRTALPLQSFDVSLFDKVMSCAVYPVVESTYFSESFPEAFLIELEHMFKCEIKFPVQQLVLQEFQSQDVALLMFGNVKAGLQQLCVRRIMHEVITAKKVYKLVHHIQETKNDGTEASMVAETPVLRPRPASQLEENQYWFERHKLYDCPESVADNWVENWDDGNEPSVHVYTYDDKRDDDSLINQRIMDERLPMDINYRRDKWLEKAAGSEKEQYNLLQVLEPDVIHCLVTEHLKLPSKLVNRFYIEAARIKLGATLYCMESPGCIENCDHESEGCTYNNVLGMDDDDDDDDDDDELDRFADFEWS